MNTEQPKLVIVEQPKVREYRFRYKCEGDSHGGLQGENSNPGHKSYPSVKLCNYHGPARITVSLVTCDDVTPPKIHAHELINKNCRNGVYLKELDSNGDLEVQFQNLGIRHVTKKNVEGVLEKKILDSIKFNNIIQGDLNVSDINLDLSRDVEMNIRKLAKSQAKDIQLNVIRLCFQAYLMDQSGTFTNLLPPVCSNPIFDSKAPGASTLKICRMDKHAGCCMGGDEVFLLCDKVQKGDIEIRFFEEGEDGMVKWQAYGQFGPSDVHRQFAIVFKTPAYWNTQIDHAISVQVQLTRPNDQEASDPKPFTYYPQHLDQEEVGKKRKKNIFPPFCTGTGTFSSGESMDSLGRKEFNFASQPKFDGFNKSADNSGARQQLMMNVCPSPDGFMTPQYMHSMHSMHSIPNPLNQMMPNAQMQFVPRSAAPTPPDDAFDTDGCVTSSDEYTSDRVQTLLTPSGDDGDECDGITEKVKVVALSATEEKGVPPSEPAEVMEHTKRQPSATDDHRLAVDIAERTSLALQDYAKTGDVMYMLLVQRHLVAVQDDNGDNALHQAIINNKLDAVQNFVRVIETIPAHNTLNQYNNMRQTPLHLVVLMNQPAMVALLLKGGTELTLSDRHGDTPVHIAARLGHVECLEKMFPTVPRQSCDATRSHVFNSVECRRSSECCDLLNFDGYSPLHLAIHNGHLAVVKLLVAARADVNRPDGRSGRVALHHAVESANVGVTGFLVLEASGDLDAPAFDGSTPLHLAVGRNHLALAAILMAAGADPSAENCDVLSDDVDGEREGEREGEDGLKEGHTAFDLAAGNDKMLQILNGASYRTLTNGVLPSQVSKSWKVSHDSGLDCKSVKGDMETLGPMIRTQIGKLLDPGSEGRDWRELAERLDLKSLITPISFSRAPTRALLDNLEGVDCTIQQLREALVAMVRTDVVALLDEELESLQPKGDEPADNSGSVTAYTESSTKGVVVSGSSTNKGVVSEGAVFHGLSASDKCESVVDSGLDSMLVSGMNES